MRTTLQAVLQTKNLTVCTSVKPRINWALKQCTYGVEGAKIIVIDIIRGIIAKRVPEEAVTRLLGLTAELEPSNHIKWEMPLYKYKRIYGTKALEKIIKTYEWDAREAVDRRWCERALCVLRNRR